MWHPSFKVSYSHGTCSLQRVDGANLYSCDLCIVQDSQHHAMNSVLLRHVTPTSDHMHSLNLEVADRCTASSAAKCPALSDLQSGIGYHSMSMSSISLQQKSCLACRWLPWWLLLCCLLSCVSPGPCLHQARHTPTQLLSNTQLLLLASAH